MDEKLTRKYKFKTEGDALAFWSCSVSVALACKNSGGTSYSGEQFGKTVTVEFLPGALIGIVTAANRYDGREVRPRRSHAD